MFLRSTVALIYTAGFLHSNITPKYTAALHLCSYAAALHLFMQQHYTCMRSSITHICVTVFLCSNVLHLCTQQYYLHNSITLMHTALHLLVQQHYTHQRRSVAHIYTAIALHTPTPQSSTHIHSNSITHTNAAA